MGCFLVAPALLASVAACWGQMSPYLSCPAPQPVVLWTSSPSIPCACGHEKLQQNVLGPPPFPRRPLLGLHYKGDYVANKISVEQIKETSRFLWLSMHLVLLTLPPRRRALHPSVQGDSPAHHVLRKPVPAAISCLLELSPTSLPLTLPTRTKYPSPHPGHAAHEGVTRSPCVTA